MKNELLPKARFEAVKEITDLNEISAGMNSAVVSYFVTADGKLCRIVSLFDSRELNFDHIPAGHSGIFRSFSGWVKCFRHLVYRLRGIEMTKSGMEWETVVMQP